jgi:hypothetical protein
MRIDQTAVITAIIFGTCLAVVQAHPSFDSAANTRPKWVTFPADGGRAGYRVEADLLVKSSQGKDVLPARWREIDRHLPPVGTTWVYLFELRHRTPLKLTAVRDGKAYYDVNDGKEHVTEDIATYHRTGRPQSPRLPFPLHPGDHWKGSYSTSYRIANIDGESLPVTEQGHTYSSVIGVSKVHVPAGIFLAYAIDRRIDWVKKDASGKNGPEHLRHPIHGFTREMMWYAPKAGRVVLEGTMSAGQAFYLEGQPEEFMRNAAVTTIELESMRRPGQEDRKNVPETSSGEQ